MAEFDHMTQEDRKLWWDDLLTTTMQSLSFEDDKSFDEFRGFVSLIESTLDVAND